MRALVTGATGFVGGHLVEALVQAGHDVTALVRSPGKTHLLNQLRVRQVAGDLHSAAALAEAVRGQELIFHVAGLVAARSEAEFLRANRDGTANLVEALRRSEGGPGRVVLVSSMAAGGPSRPGAPRTGEELARPVTQYGRSKLAGEEVLRASNLPWVIVRPPMIYGPRDREVLRLFQLASRGIVPVFGDGRQELSAVYGPDLAVALLSAGLARRAIGRTYYACHPATFTSGDLVRRVGVQLGQNVRVIPLPRRLGQVMLGLTGLAARITGRPTILTADKANEFFEQAWTGDPAPLTSDTGWRAAHDLDLGLQLTAQWYRDQGWL